MHADCSGVAGVRGYSTTVEPVIYDHPLIPVILR